MLPIHREKNFQVPELSIKNIIEIAGGIFQGLWRGALGIVYITKKFVVHVESDLKNIH